ncbi:hypothetical protein M2375_002197 [Comamonas sp. BIGb0152]|nr:hypothetical protein [Comamonas sp. BIGb0152]
MNAALHPSRLTGLPRPQRHQQLFLLSLRLAAACC